MRPGIEFWLYGRANSRERSFHFLSLRVHSCIYRCLQRCNAMSDCCASETCSTSRPRKRRCPANGVKYHSVAEKTVLHHVKEAWRLSRDGRIFYFCEDPDCDVVYFANDDSVIQKSGVRTDIGTKSRSADAPVCYCFGVTKADAEANTEIRKFVVAETKRGICSCETSNPSGRCCLKAFPRTSANE